MDDVDIARIAHEVNRAYCSATGDDSQLEWDQAADWQRASALSGVAFHKANLFATPEDSHDSWLERKKLDGWTYGAANDPEERKHPCMVPYAELSVEQRVKDYLFRAVVHACSGVACPDG